MDTSNTKGTLLIEMRFDVMNSPRFVPQRADVFLIQFSVTVTTGGAYNQQTPPND